jgi:hypothetical protein
MSLIMMRYARLDDHGLIPWSRRTRGVRRVPLFALHLLEYTLFIAFGLAVLATVLLLMFASWLLGVERNDCEPVRREVPPAPTP